MEVFIYIFCFYMSNKCDVFNTEKKYYCDVITTFQITRKIQIFSLNILYSFQKVYL